MQRENKAREKYASFSDDKIIKIARDEAHELSELGYEILMEEINYRGLSLEDIAIDHSLPSAKEIDFYIELIENLPCPGCGVNNFYLTARVTREVSKNDYRECTIIGCDDCLSEWSKEIRRKTYRYGWRSLSGGIMKTLHALYYNFDASNSRSHESEMMLRQFVIQHIDYLRENRESEGRLISLLSRENGKRL